jgi:phosphatidylglycerol---prolipoprotein diacylglyceryl transferase
LPFHLPFALYHLPLTFPFLIPLGPWVVHPHFLFETLAYLIGFRLYLRRRRQHGDHLDDGPRWSVVTAAAVGAVLGSRLLFWIEDPAATLGNLDHPLVLIGGKSIVGALVGGWIAVEIVKRWIGVREATGDLFAVPLAVGIGVGRIGCFLSGLPDGTYGTATSLPWGVNLGDGIARHPTALYESLFMFGLALVLVRVEPHARRGNVFKLFMTAYLTFRLFVDGIKPGVTTALGLTAIQWVCLGGLAYYAWWVTTARGRIAASAAQEV